MFPLRQKPDRASLKRNPACLEGWRVRFEPSNWYCNSCKNCFFDISSPRKHAKLKGKIAFFRTCTVCKTLNNEICDASDLGRVFTPIYDLDRVPKPVSLVESAMTLLENKPPVKLEPVEDELDDSWLSSSAPIRTILQDNQEQAEESEDLAQDKFAVGTPIQHRITLECGIIGDATDATHDPDEVPVIWDDGQDNGYYNKDFLEPVDPDQPATPPWYTMARKLETQGKRLDNQHFQMFKDAGKVQESDEPAPSILNTDSTTLVDAQPGHVVTFKHTYAHQWIVCEQAIDETAILDLETKIFMRLKNPCSYPVEISELEVVSQAA